MRVLKFGVVGVTNTAVDYLVLNALVFGIGAPVAVANVVSYSAGIANSWFWNRRWTFSDRATASTRLALPAFVAVNLVGLVLNTGVVFGLVSLARTTGLADAMSETLLVNIAKTLAIAVSYTWNYLAISRFVFRAR